MPGEIKTIRFHVWVFALMNNIRPPSLWRERKKLWETITSSRTHRVWILLPTWLSWAIRIQRNNKSLLLMLKIVLVRRETNFLREQEKLNKWEKLLQNLFFYRRIFIRNSNAFLCGVFPFIAYTTTITQLCLKEVSRKLWSRWNFSCER